MSSILSSIFTRGALPVGIDLGPSGARLLQFQRRRAKLSVRCAAKIDFAMSESIENDQAATDRLAGEIARRVESGGFAGSRCVLSIDDRWLRVRSIRVPRMNDEELDRAVRLDAANRLGFNEGQECEIDWLRAGEVIQGSDVREEVILAGAKREPIERLVYALAARGLRPLAVEPGFVACARAYSRMLRRTQDQGVTRLILDIGRKISSVMVIRGVTVAFYKPVEIGGEMMTFRAAERLGLEPATIAELREQRMKSDGAVDPKVDRAIYEAVRPVLGDLAQELALCQRYYSVTFRGSRPEMCIVTGNGAREPHLTEMIAEALHLPTEVGRPFEGLDASALSPAPNERYGAAEWSAAAGLALRFAFSDRAIARAPSATALSRATDASMPVAPVKEAA